MDKSLNISILLDLYGKLLKDKQRNFIDLYYNEDLSLSEISENYNMTRQGVRDSIKRGADFLIEIDSKLNIYKKLNTINLLLEDISFLSDQIYQYNKNDIKSEEIDNMSSKIISKISDYLSENT